MSLASVIMQNLLFPDKREFAACEELFFRDGLPQDLPKDRIIMDDCRWDFVVDNGKVVEDRRLASHAGRMRKDMAIDPSSVHYDPAERCIVIPAGKTADFSCYFNMISAAKWLKLTCVENIILSLDLQGDGVVDVLAYDLPDFESAEQIEAFKRRRREGRPDGSLHVEGLASASVPSKTRTVATIAIGRPETTLVSFIISAQSEVKLYGGAWLGQVDSGSVRDVDICITTTTFKKEEYIARNVAVLKAAMRDDAELSRHLQVIVVDNGRTLNPADFENDRVRVFDNINAGGSGGFARGMIEALQLEKRPTHLIVMDDDVLVIPESIRRTRTLLSVLRPEYRRHFVAGAMLRMEDMAVQHEDVGAIDPLGHYDPKKGAHALRTVIDCASNEVMWPQADFEYAAWWYCCIPMEYVSDTTLPAPFFIRGDDVEFSIRSGAGVVSLNGICVWHVGFTQKFNASLEYYQVMRNSLILRAFHPRCAEIDFIGYCGVVLNRLCSEFAYDYADMVLDAVEDYLQGPSILEAPNGAEILHEKGLKNERLLPLDDVWGGRADFGCIFYSRNSESPVSVLRRKAVTATHNGQRLFGQLTGDETGFCPYDLEYRHEPLFMKSMLVCVNPANATATLRKRDAERYAEIADRRVALFARYNQEHERVEQEYREAYPVFTSIEFWHEYLKLDSDAV